MSYKSEKRGDKHSRRTLARLNAVQAYYQKSMDDSSAGEVVDQFMAHRIGAEIDGLQFKDADKNLFKDLVIGTDERLVEIDEKINAVLDKERSMEKLDLIMQACLRVAVYELLARIDTKAVVIITEYVGLARTFFTGKEPTFVNGVLDRLAREIREGEFSD
ncbi:transcription antitermination factor NusB [Sneathiella sp. P13V-1]|uniref:transcription antitermination factor NusB n=1 Tax=Sneathiella sp. P13V-1 TaxID=2697366 RepID=UPI00187B5F17|nr:transcription antitermination factor NusB [Sneathiella sp. P13V-1]MBE7636922.1 transcription antitermination factor NusB [Sneathiella sp. P13V-1]